MNSLMTKSANEQVIYTKSLQRGRLAVIPLSPYLYIIGGRV